MAKLFFAIALLGMLCGCSADWSEAHYPGIWHYYRVAAPKDDQAQRAVKDCEAHNPHPCSDTDLLALRQFAAHTHEEKIEAMRAKDTEISGYAHY